MWDLGYNKGGGFMSVFPNQGHWSEGEYLSVTRDARFLVELVDGFIGVLPMPTEAHQNVVSFLFAMLKAFITPKKLGRVLQSPFRVRLATNQFREPDVCFMLRENDARRTNDFWEGADLVIEVVSDDPNDRVRDLDTKRAAYAQAGIKEYWIVDPREARVLVLKLLGEQYATHAEVGTGGRVNSALLPGFELEVDAVLASAEFED
jgi:Uma2 family endonuclease